MNILLTGATGYIGKRLLQALLEQGNEVTCCVRDTTRFSIPAGYESKVNVLETSFCNRIDAPDCSAQFDIAYYLIHSLSTATEGYEQEELKTAEYFKLLAEQLKCKQVVYLGGIANESELSEHLSSRKNVENILKSGSYSTTILRAAIIVGSGSASFEIIRDLVEKLPVMITPRWVNTKCQPIAVHNVIDYLTGVIGRPEAYNQTFDIGGPDILTYQQMMLDFGEVRGLRRFIYTVPVMTPRLSSYWLYFITATNYSLAVNLVNSMKIEVVCSNNNLQQLLNIDLIGYKEAVERAFGKIEQNMVVSSWTDSLSSSTTDADWNKHIQVPTHGCFTDKRKFKITGAMDSVKDRIWSIGGETGWYYATWLWNIRGFIDKLFGGVGLRRGRTNAQKTEAGDALDFWRVLVADKNNGRLLLYAEMKLPGEAWLEFKIENNEMIQQATFRPKGLTGRLYWYSLVPLHNIIFKGMGKQITNNK